jgi:competence factor transporting protein
LTDSKIKKNNKIFSENQNRTLELFNSIKRGSEEEQTFNFENLLKDKYFKFVDESIKTSNKTSTLYFVNNNIISLILKSAVFGLTVYLVLMVKATTLTLSLYLILTPYLSTSAENLIEFFAVFAKIGEVENKLSELESLKYTTTKQKVLSSSPFETFNLTFYHAELSEPNAPQIFDANFKVNFCESAEFVGDENSGKRAIFYLLQKKYKLSSGTIFIDDKNIFDIESETYKKLISFTSKQTHFFNISIMENLQMVCSSRNKIFACFKEWGLKSDIFKLEEKENTIITQNSNKKLLYFLGILRAYLSDSKIIAIYETPENFTALDREKFRKILGVMKKDRTILYFSHSDEFSSVFDKTFYVEGSKIKNSKYEKV